MNRILPTLMAVICLLGKNVQAQTDTTSLNEDKNFTQVWDSLFAAVY